MNLRTYLDAMPHGGLTEFAKVIGVSPIYLSQLAARQNGREPSPELCVVIERATDGTVPRKELRPDDFWKIWPDLSQAADTITPAATKTIARTPYEEALRDAMMPILMVSKHEKPGDRRSESHPPDADLERRENEAAALVRVEEEAAKNAKKG